MQSKGPLAVRNLVGRNPELIPTLLEAGVESSLREVMNMHGDGYVHNLAKAALRDLHCDVHLKEQWHETLDNGDADCENHWDKFLDPPAAQAAIREEMEA